MGFESTIALLLTPLVAWIVVLYFIKSKPRHRVLPSTALWDLVLLKVSENSLWQRFRASLFLFLQVLAAALAVAALARPYLAGGVSGDVVLALDSSASMLTRDGSPRRFDDARTAALRVVEDLGPGSRVMVCVFGARARVALPWTTDRALARSVLSSLDCSAAEGCPPSEVLSLLASAAGKDARHVFVFSDGFDPAGATVALPSARVEVRTFGTARANAGFVQWRMAGTPDKAALTLTVANFGPEPWSGEVDLAGAGLARSSGPLSAPAGEQGKPGEAVAAFRDLALGGAGDLLRARLRRSGGRDLLPEDDSLWLRVRRDRVRIGVVSAGGAEPVLRLLRTLPNVEPLLVPPAEVPRQREALDACAALLCDDFVDGAVLRRPAVVFHPLAPSPLSSGALARKPRSYVADPTHPVMRYLGFPGLKIESAAALDRVTESHPLLASEAGPLVVAREAAGGVRQVVVGFPLGATDLPWQVGFPVFVTNALRWILGDDLQMASVSRVGTLVAGPGGEGPLLVVRADPLPNPEFETSSRELAATTGVVDALDMPGVVALARGAAVAAPVLDEVRSGRRPGLWYTAATLSPSESDVAPRGAPSAVVGGAADDAGSAGGQAGYWRWAALACVAVMALEWLLYCRKGA